MTHPNWSKLGRALVLGALLLVLAAPPAPPAAAQSLYFEVPELKLQAFVQTDGSVLITYDITFQNTSFGAPIDAVDIGTPNVSYSLRKVTASLDGEPQTSIVDSPYVNPGFAVNLSPAIPPGGRGTLHVEFPVSRLLYTDVTRPGYLSFRITPFWFDDEFVSGRTHLQIAVHLLPGISPDDALYQLEPFSEKALFQDRAVVLWDAPNYEVTGPYLVGVSFPSQGVTAGVIKQNVLDLAAKWLEDSPGTAFFLGLLILATLAVAFFRFSGGTGLSVFVLLAGVAGIAMLASAYVELALVPVAVVAVIWVEVGLRRRRRQYLPAIAQVEGGGIKRGLTAPEAAVLLELPLGRVLGLVLFGLLKKGVLKQLQATPLIVRVDPTFVNTNPAEERRAARLKAAQVGGFVLHEYEHGFLDILQAAPEDRPVTRLDFGKAMKGLVEGVAARMKGFDLSDTQDYYRRIVSRAVKEAQSVGEVATEPGQRERVIDRDLEWIMMDQRFPTVLNTPIYRYQPIWARPFPRFGGSVAPAKPAAPAAGGKTSVGDVAAGFAGWAENTMGGLASAIAPGSLQVPKGGGGFIDLSGADKVTGDIFKALGESSGGSGRGGGRSGGGRSGGGRSCACACAGCACACACAGGGR